MGLIKHNYAFKGYTLPTAYARVQVNTEKKEATFYIGASRKDAFEQPIEKVKLYGIPFTHKNNPLVEAYEFAKGSYEDLVYNIETKKYEKATKRRQFYDWLNDIVE